MRHSQRVSVVVGLLAVLLILLAQYLSWSRHRQLNPGLLAALALVLPPLWLALRRRDGGGSGSGDRSTRG